MKNLFLIFVILLGSVVVYNNFYKNNATPTNPQQTELAILPLPEIKEENNFSGIPIPNGINNAVTEKKNTRIANAPTSTATKKVTKNSAPTNGFDAMRTEKEKLTTTVVVKKKVVEKKGKKTGTKKVEVQPKKNEPVKGFFLIPDRNAPGDKKPKESLKFLGREEINPPTLQDALKLGRKEN